MHPCIPLDPEEGHHSLVCRKASELEQDLGGPERGSYCSMDGRGEKNLSVRRPSRAAGPERPLHGDQQVHNPAGPHFPLQREGSGALLSLGVPIHSRIL